MYLQGRPVRLRYLVAPKFADNLTLFQPGGTFCPPSARSHLKYPCRYVPDYLYSKSLHTKGQKISKKKICCPGFFQKKECWGISMYWNCPNVRFLEEIQDTIICFWDFLTFSKWTIFNKMTLQESRMNVFSRSLRRQWDLGPFISKEHNTISAKWNKGQCTKSWDLILENTCTCKQC